MHHRHRRLRPRLRCRLRSLTRMQLPIRYKTLISQALADNATDHIHESGAVGTLARVEAIDLLVHVAREMAGIDAHVGSLDGALQERPEVFEAVGVAVIADVG